MRKLILSIALLITANTHAQPGGSYANSVYAATQGWGIYHYGDREWDDKNQEWLDSDSDEPYPEELRDIDGNGYNDSRDVASEKIECP